MARTKRNGRFTGNCRRSERLQTPKDMLINIFPNPGEKVDRKKRPAFDSLLRRVVGGK